MTETKAKKNAESQLLGIVEMKGKHQSRPRR